MGNEISGTLTAMGRDGDGVRTVWFRGDADGYLLPPELFEQAWKLLGSEVRVVATPERRLQSIIPVIQPRKRTRGR